MLDLENKVSIVTGAGKADGIGYAACSKLVEAGSRVFLTDLAVSADERARLEERAATLGALCEAYPLDVTSDADIAGLVEHVLTHHGRIDVLFNNAGTPVGAGDFLELSDQAWDLSFAINVMGMVRLCRAVLPSMQAERQGSIINNASLAGLGAVAGLAAYSASKFAVVGLTKSLAAEFGSSGVRCNAVCPGMVWTEMGRFEVQQFKQADESFESAKDRIAADVPLQRWAEPDEVGDAVVYLASKRSAYINGVTLPIAGGLAPGL